MAFSGQIQRFQQMKAEMETAASPPPAPTALPSGLRAVGDRVDDGTGAPGSVRYVGPVATSNDASTLYYGIEWDVWGRGKNDGSVVLPSGERVVYFPGPAGRSERNSELSFKCSFVKASKFDASTERSSLLQRLKERYSSQAPSRVPHSGADVMVTGEVGTTLGSEKPIEFVGAHKLRQKQTLQSIEKISLSGCQIAALGTQEPGELTALAPNLTELDLSRNLFSSWQDILPIVRELPELETLILSGNRFQVDAEEAASSEVFPNLRVLVLNQTLLAWDDVCTLAKRHFPGLKELHLADNEYTDEQFLGSSSRTTAPWWETLSVLDFSLNRLSSWERVLQTVGAMFTNLSQLLLNRNNIATLVANNETSAVFQKLQALSLNDNRVDSWTSVDALNAFPALDTLRFSRNPLVAHMSMGETRMLIVARTDRIAVFNASPVRAKDRKEAEQLYLKRILHELAVVGNDEGERERVLAQHPRFPRLRELYPEISIDTGGAGGNGFTAGPRKLASSLLKITIVPMSMLATSLEPLAKKVPQQMKVAQLKLLIEAKFGIDPAAQVLSFRTDSKSMPMLLDDESAEVGYCGLQNGAEVLVNDNE